MASITTTNFLAGARPSQLSLPRTRTVLPHPTICKRALTLKIGTLKTRAVVETMPLPDPITVDKEVKSRKLALACPICYEKFTYIGNQSPSVNSSEDTTLQCNTCRKTFTGVKTHVDLTAASGAKGYSEAMAPSTEFFRVPLISYIYERGWRQNFSFWLGFPGPEKEFEMIKGYLEPVLGGNIIDASCGSGLFARLFAKSGLFSEVVALDYSENMLKECYEFIEKEDAFPKENITLVRADISRLPFARSSVDVVHAGAALHCWPSPSSAVAEISRVLRPGGVFVATTYILDGPYSYLPIARPPLRQSITQITGNNSFISESELEDLCTACGLVDFSCVRNTRFVMLSATKPN